jgi:hypothetical protein
MIVAKCIEHGRWKRLSRLFAQVQILAKRLPRLKPLRRLLFGDRIGTVEMAAIRGHRVKL